MSYSEAKKKYSDYGIDTEYAIEKLKNEISDLKKEIEELTKN